MCDVSRHDEEDDFFAAHKLMGFAFRLRSPSSADKSLSPSCTTRKADVCSPEMAHFFAQNILVPRALFSEN
jgi:hypothetical protein